MIRRLATLLFVGALGAVSTQIHAQVNITITGGREEALPIAVVPFQLSDGTAQPAADMAPIVRADLQRSGVFNPIPPENFVAQPGRRSQVQFRNWRALGADHLVVGEIGRKAGGDYELRTELIDVYGGDSLASKLYTVSPDALRSAAHTVSNLIFSELVGRSGAFDSKLVYVRESGSGEDAQYELMYADADGARAQSILTSPAPLMSPDWTADGERVAYVSFEGGRPRIYVQTIASGEREVVAAFEGMNSAPAFSPDGERLAMTRSTNGNPDIHILDLATGESRRLTDHYGIDTEPVWAPDGDHIFFTSSRSGGPQIFRIAADGGDAERVTYAGQYNASPDLGPDGELLTMVHRDDGEFHIAIKNLEKDLMRELTEGALDESPSFSPNGAMIVYTRAAGDRTELATVSVHGRANDALREFDGEVREPAWSPIK